MKMEKVKVRIKRLHPDAKIPQHKSDEAAGFDVYAIEEKIIAPGEVALIPSGTAIEIAPGFALQIWDRSGLSIKGIHRLAGLIDSDYRGEIKIVLYNASKQEYKIEKGDRVAQIAIVPVVRAEFEEVNELSETARGDGGFHSTGKK